RASPDFGKRPQPAIPKPRARASSTSLKRKGILYPRRSCRFRGLSHGSQQRKIEGGIEIAVVLAHLRPGDELEGDALLFQGGGEHAREVVFGQKRRRRRPQDQGDRAIDLAALAREEAVVGLALIIKLLFRQARKPELELVF